MNTQITSERRYSALKLLGITGAAVAVLAVLAFSATLKYQWYIATNGFHLAKAMHTKLALPAYPGKGLMCLPSAAQSQYCLPLYVSKSAIADKQIARRLTEVARDPCRYLDHDASVDLRCDLPTHERPVLRFGITANEPGWQREPVDVTCTWNSQQQTEIGCL